MVLLLVLATIAACIIVELVLRKRKEARAREEAVALKTAPGVAPGILAEEFSHKLPGGLFFHSGHTWAHLEFSGEAKVGMDEFAHGVVGTIDAIELPERGRQVRQGEKLFTVVQGAKRVDLVSPLDGVVCASNEDINNDIEAARRDPYGWGWIVAIRPSGFTQNLRRLRSASETVSWLEKEIGNFKEFIALHMRPAQEAGVTMQDGGVHIDGIMERMDGELLQIFVKKFLK